MYSPKLGLLVATLLFGASATATGCAGRSANAQPPAAETSTSAADDVTGALMEHHRYHHHGGVTLLIVMSLETLGVSAEQRGPIQNIRADLRSHMEPARVAEQHLMSILADGVAANNIDTAQVDAAIAQVTAAAATVHEACSNAINQLHAVLTPEQRAALVDKVEAHWAVWQRVNVDDTKTADSDVDQLGMLAEGLGLTTMQTDTIRSGLVDRMKGSPPLNAPEISTHVHAFGDAFRGASFDAKTINSASGADAQVAGWGAMREARFVETVSPALTPAQRAKFAANLRAHASHPSTEGQP